MYHITGAYIESGYVWKSTNTGTGFTSTMTPVSPGWINKSVAYDKLVKGDVCYDPPCKPRDPGPPPPNPPSTPEIDAGSGMNAIALLAGAMLVIRGRKS